MLERGWGRIVAVTTPFAATPGAKAAPYAAAKAAAGDVRSARIAREVAEQRGDRQPGRRPPDRHGARAPHVADTAERRGDDAEEIAAAMRTLCSDEAAAVNGARIPLDGR